MPHNILMPISIVLSSVFYKIKPWLKPPILEVKVASSYLIPQESNSLQIILTNFQTYKSQNILNLRLEAYLELDKTIYVIRPTFYQKKATLFFPNEFYFSQLYTFKVKSLIHLLDVTKNSWPFA